MPNLFVIASHIAFILINYGRRWVQNTFSIASGSLPQTKSILRLSRRVSTKYTHIVDKELLWLHRRHDIYFILHVHGRKLVVHPC